METLANALNVLEGMLIVGETSAEYARKEKAITEKVEALRMVLVEFRGNKNIDKLADVVGSINK